MDDQEVSGWIALLFAVVVVVGIIIILRRSDQTSLSPSQERMVALLASLAATATAHRDICRLLVAEGTHHECPLCHASEHVQAQIAGHRSGWMHMIRMAQHPSWLDWDVPISRIVIDQFRKGTGRKTP